MYVCRLVMKLCYLKGPKYIFFENSSGHTKIIFETYALRYTARSNRMSVWGHVVENHFLYQLSQS